MENNKMPESQSNSDWLDELLKQPTAQEDIDADTHTDSDMEFDRIMREALSDSWENPEPETPAKSEAVADMLYQDEGIQSPSQPIEPEEEVTDEGPRRKVRPRRKNGYGLFGLPHILSTAIWLVLAVTIGVSLGRLLWVCATDVLAFGRKDQTIYITITDSDTKNMEAVAQKLHHAGLIKYPKLFLMYADLANAEEKISEGTFKLNSLYDYHALVGGMSATSSYRESVEVLIPEGYTCAQIFKLLEEKGVCSAKELEEYAAQSEFSDYWFLEGVKRGDKYTLEGFLFPDTYEFYTNDTAKRVFIKFLNRFEDQLDEELETHIATLNTRLANMMRRNGYDQSYINENTVNLRDIITIASMIEKESAHTGENYNVSSVIYNRLTNQKAFRCLQIDATLVYALGGKSDLNAEDLALDNPYNSYLYPGLPPTPIANPGLSSILAALSPADTGYYYYALNPAAGEHHFSKTLQEHNEFLNSLR